MSDGKLHLDLETCIDRNGRKFYIAKLKGPFVIDCHEKPNGGGGVAFMVFVAEEGSEELQISSITPPKTEHKKY